MTTNDLMARTLPATAPLPADRQQAVRETLAVGSACALALAVAALGIWFALSATIRADFQRYLVAMATSSTLLIDPELHRNLTRPAQQDGPDYLRAVEPLRRLRTAIPEVRYIYTAVRDGPLVRFVLDAATPGDQDGDGVEDQAGLWEIYTASDPAMQMALGDDRQVGQASATDRPYDDKWGSFMTGWAPLIDTAGEQFGALGIDVDAGLYSAHLQRARFWALAGTLPAVLLLLLGGTWFYRMRLRSLADARDATESARALNVEQQRLRNVIEGTRVGLWEASIDGDTHLITVDERWAAMLGRRAGELNPLSPERFIPMLVHPADAPAVNSSIERSLRDPDYIFDLDTRMRHADGRWIWTEVRGRVVERDERGHPIRMAGTQMDVSDRKAAELLLQEQQGSFRSLFELSALGICLTEYPSGRLLQANDALSSALGYTRDELLQLAYMDITPEDYLKADRELALLIGRDTRFGPCVKEFLHKAGHRVRVTLSGARIKDAADRDVAWIIVQPLPTR